MCLSMLKKPIIRESEAKEARIQDTRIKKRKVCFILFSFLIPDSCYLDSELIKVYLVIAQLACAF
ncbi:MAG: hypothetical protein JWQ54_2439 [Mucilaginibacter sp.]|nr:hypothetical protein [Mucilaginibacter sp.]